MGKSTATKKKFFLPNLKHPNQDLSEDVRTKVLNKTEMNCAELAPVEETSLDKEDDIEESLITNH